MKSMSFLLLLLSLMFLVSCDAEEETPTEGFRPGACAEQKSSGGCGVDWFFTFPKAGFPTNAQVVINDTVVIDQCVPTSQWATSSTSQVVEFELNDFSNLDGTQIVNLQVFNRFNCNETKKLYLQQNDQKYILENSGGKKTIRITKV